jgi:hypothetical protein
MTKLATPLRSIFFLAPAALLAAYLGLPGGAAGPVPAGLTAQSAAPAAGVELPCHRIPNLPEAAEWYFARDGKFLIGNAKGAGDAAHHVYVSSFDGSDIRRINYPFVEVRGLAEAGGRPNGEISLRDLLTGEEGRLTFDPGFDGFPSISADGYWLTFSSSRGGKPGQGTLFQYIMDVFSLGFGPR